METGKVFKPVDHELLLEPLMRFWNRDPLEVLGDDIGLPQDVMLHADDEEHILLLRAYPEASVRKGIALSFERAEFDHEGPVGKVVVTREDLTGCIQGLSLVGPPSQYGEHRMSRGRLVAQQNAEQAADFVVHIGPDRDAIHDGDGHLRSALNLVCADDEPVLFERRQEGLRCHERT